MTLAHDLPRLGLSNKIFEESSLSVLLTLISMRIAVNIGKHP